MVSTDGGIMAISYWGIILLTLWLLPVWLFFNIIPGRNGGAAAVTVL